MASVYYLFDDAIHVEDDIVDQYSQRDENLQEHHNAATVIQRTYRGYVARSSFLENVNAVIVLQKYIRGWLVRYHLPDFLGEYYDRICIDTYTKAAVRIQAHWRGILVRKEVNVKKIMEKKGKDLVEQNSAIKDGNDLCGIPKSKDTNEEETSVAEGDNSPYGWSPLGRNAILKRYILEIMFDRHHLISTKMHEGVLSGNRDLKDMEQILKTLPWKDYMTRLRKLYRMYEEKEKGMKPCYLFGDKKMRAWEDINRLRDKRRDLKDVGTTQYVADNRKPFRLTSKLEKPGYQRDLLLEGKYVKRQFNITRSIDKSKNISDKEFVLAFKEVVKECDIPTYYADFLYRDCLEHYLTD